MEKSDSSILVERILPNSEIFLPRFLIAGIIFALLMDWLGVRPSKSLPLGQVHPQGHHVALFVFLSLFGLLADIVDFGRRRWNNDSEKGYLKALLVLSGVSFAILFYLLKMIVAPKWYEPWW